MPLGAQKNNYNWTRNNPAMIPDHIVADFSCSQPFLWDCFVFMAQYNRLTKKNIRICAWQSW